MNQYKLFLDELFDRILELRHTASMINSTLNSSIKAFANYQGGLISGSALVISDWSGPTDNGWAINFHTGFRKITLKENFENEIKRITSQECCYAFAQAFEALEKFFKDCAMYNLPPKLKFESRENLNGDKLFRTIKQAGDPYFSEVSSNNNKSLRFKELWSILSECRHAIVHSKSIVHLNKIKITDYHFRIFEHLFYHSNKGDTFLIIELDYRRLDKLLKVVSEFAFQVYKSLSQKENLAWEIK